MKNQHILEAFKQADLIVGMDQDEHELEFAKYYAGLILTFIEAAMNDEAQIRKLQAREDMQRNLMRGCAEGWVDYDNLGGLER